MLNMAAAVRFEKMSIIPCCSIPLSSLPSAPLLLWKSSGAEIRPHLSPIAGKRENKANWL